MYQLTVEAADTVTVTDHPDREDAHGQLLRRAVTGDYYLHTVQIAPAHTTYELLRLVEGYRRPRSAGHAVIERLDTDGRGTVDPQRVTAAARRWIVHHQSAWAPGAGGTPADRCPTAILSAARAEARNWFRAGLLASEAARLARVGFVPRSGQHRLDELRCKATREPVHHDEHLAPRVSTQLGVPASASTLAAPIWWYALPSWGAGAP